MNCWEGCTDLVRLNLQNPEVRQYLFDVVRGWVKDYDIDGLRLDVAYCPGSGIPGRTARGGGQPETGVRPDGETLHGDYKRWMNDHACH